MIFYKQRISRGFGISQRSFDQLFKIIIRKYHYLQFAVFRCSLVLVQLRVMFVDLSALNGAGAQKAGLTQIQINSSYSTIIDLAC